MINYYRIAFNDKNPQLGAVPVYGPLGSKGVDIFRLDAHGKIVEYWDVLVQLSATTANGNPEV